MQFRDEWGELEHPEKNTRFLEKDSIEEAMQFLDLTIKSITVDETKQQALTMAAYCLYNTAVEKYNHYHIRQIARLADEK